MCTKSNKGFYENLEVQIILYIIVSLRSVLLKSKSRDKTLILRHRILSSREAIITKPPERVKNKNYSIKYKNYGGP